MKEILKESFDLSNMEHSLLRIFRSSLPKNSNMFYEHHHTAFEITMAIKGSGIYATNASEFSFCAGDVFFFSTDEYHWIKELHENTDFLNIHFEPRFIWSDHFGISHGALTKIFLNRKNNPHNKINAESESSKTIRRLIFLMEEEALGQKKEYESMLKTFLVQILVEMIRSYEGKLSKTETSYSAQMLDAMEQALTYIDSHLTYDLTLDEIASVAHMSKNYFCRQFKTLNGISPWEYILVKRIERAVSYLNTTDYTRLEIAEMCGFNNASNFYHAFKKVTGKSPADYKHFVE